MESYKNTKDDFWASLDAGKNSIVCPCCGSHMSLQYSSSYRLMLTRESSVHLNQQLSFYRSTIIAVERILKRHNSSVYENSVKNTSFPIDQDYISHKGEFINASGTSVRDLLYRLDIEKLDEIVSKWPKLKNNDAEDKKKTINSHDLLQIVQMPTLAAGLNIIAFDQPGTEAILSNYKPQDFKSYISGFNITDEVKEGKSSEDVVFSHLKEKFPYILSYCDRASTVSGDDPILRVLAILIIYFGHEAKHSLVTDIKEFTFGTYAQLRNWHGLGELLTSYYYLSSVQEIFPEFTKYIQSKAEKTGIGDDFLKLGAVDNVEKFVRWKNEIPQFEDVVLYTVDFACSGKPASIPVGATVIARRKNGKVERSIEEEISEMVESEMCGWIPKEKATESLLLVGGTASSKTTLLQSTIVQVKRAAANLGMVFETSSPLSSLLLQYYEQRFDLGNWDGATETGDRTSIQISLRQADNPENVYHLVINDIAGEHFEEMLMIEKDYNVIQSPMSYAKNIIFLFDLIAFRQLGALLQDSEGNDKEYWKNVIDQRESQSTVGRSVADSRDLLIKLVSRLVSASGKSTLPIDRSFILVIPKCDMYIQRGMFLNGWVTKLTQSGQFKRLGSDDESPYMSTWNFKPQNGETNFESALNGIKEMSDSASMAIKELSKKLNTEETSVSAERVALNIASILTYLEKTFNDVKVVPVSALGRTPDKTENPADGFSMKAIPLFCEALLLLPMIKMSIKRNTDDTTTS